MQLSLQTFSSLMQNMAASVQAAAAQVLDLTVGSATRAVLEANASVTLWMQWLILQVLQSTRAATSSGSDLDTWMADMTLVRLPAVAATGVVTLSRYTALAPAQISVGSLMRTADGSQIFTVVGDPTNAAWDAASGSYLLAAGTASVGLPVAAQVAGSSGNVQAGAVTLLGSAIPGVDSVVNEAAFQNGCNAESDAAFRARFQNFLQSRSRATVGAIAYAIASIQQGIGYVIQENVDTAGVTRPGNFVVTVDDGSGTPPASLLTTVAGAIEAVRPVGSSYAVQRPTTLTANISLTISAGSQKPQAAQSVAGAIGEFVDALPIGAPLPLTKLAQVAYGAAQSVTNVTSILINGSAADLVPGVTGVVKVGAVSVN